MTTQGVPVVRGTTADGGIVYGKFEVVASVGPDEIVGFRHFRVRRHHWLFHVEDTVFPVDGELGPNRTYEDLCPGMGGEVWTHVFTFSDAYTAVQCVYDKSTHSDKDKLVFYAHGRKVVLNTPGEASRALESFVC
tara:strand:- start:1319 stop:1723 length:405 start_codon:yes stop_codon:yes gene_type:complete